jgi:hypothetical protein
MYVRSRLWWTASLHFRIPDGKHRVTEGTVTTGIQAPWNDDPQLRKQAALAEAEQAFRELGLGTTLDKLNQFDRADGARVSLSVSLA